MKKYMIIVLVIIGFVLGGCTDSSMTSYDITLDTLGQHEITDMNSMIELKKQAGDMYNIGAIAGCRVLAAKGCDDGSIMIATSVKDESGKNKSVVFSRLEIPDGNTETVATQNVALCDFLYVTIVSTDPLIYAYTTEIETSMGIVRQDDKSEYSIMIDSTLIYKTDNYIVYSGDGKIFYYNINDIDRDGDININTIDAVDMINKYDPDVTEMTDWIDIYSVNASEDKIYITCNTVDIYEISLKDALISSHYTADSNGNRAYGQDYYLVLDDDYNIVLKYDTQTGECINSTETGENSMVLNARYIVWADGQKSKTVTCIDMDNMSDYTSYDLVSSSSVYDVTYVPYTDALILEMTGDLYVLWDVFDMYPDI